MVFPDTVRNAAKHRNQQHQNNNMQSSNVQSHMRNQRLLNQQNTNQVVGTSNPQQILDHHDENLSDKEVYPGMKKQFIIYIHLVIKM